jgi:queuine tRNA-ribosyltransferase
MLGPILLTLHNLTYYQRLVAQARAAIMANDYRSFMAEKTARWDPTPPPDDPTNAAGQDVEHNNE